VRRVSNPKIAPYFQEYFMKKEEKRQIFVYLISSKNFLHPSLSNPASLPMLMNLMRKQK